MRNMIIAFFLNLIFAIFEFIGGLMTNSVAIMSDAIHDIGDAASIGFACLYEKKSRKEPDNKFTFGYSRYSIMAAVKTAIILATSSVAIIVNAIVRIANPQEIDYNGMLIFAIIGFTVNAFAVFFTRHGETLNAKTINLHMLEDVMGWAIVLIGAIIMKFTDFSAIDIILSIGTSTYILLHAGMTLYKAMNIFLERTPKRIRPQHIKVKICMIDGVEDVHHLRVWQFDECNIYATVHVVINEHFDAGSKETIREILHSCGVTNSTIEVEDVNNQCGEPECIQKAEEDHNGHCHHHHHHHHH